MNSNTSLLKTMHQWPDEPGRNIELNSAQSLGRIGLLVFYGYYGIVMSLVRQNHTFWFERLSMQSTSKRSFGYRSEWEWLQLMNNWIF